MKSRIAIYPDYVQKQWVCWFRDEPEIVELMGTDLIPTPYTLHKPGHEVLAEIKNRNLEHDVYLSF